MKPENPDITTDIPYVTDKRSHTFNDNVEIVEMFVWGCRYP